MGRIRFGVKNAKYAKITYTNGVASYGSYVDLPGAKSISLAPRGETVQEYADDALWFTEAANDGYEGTLNVEEIPEAFLTDILGQTKDTTTGLLTETSNDNYSEFALAFEFTHKGDTLTGKRAVLYRCKCNRPNMDGTGKQNSITPDTETINITAMPRTSDYKVKSTCVSSDTAYATFFNGVPGEVTTTTEPVTSN